MKITSPNYPNTFDPLTNCIWSITAPQGHYVTVDFEVIDVSNEDMSQVSQVSQKKVYSKVLRIISKS